MKNDFFKTYYGKTVASVLVSAIIMFIFEIFLIININNIMQTAYVLIPGGRITSDSFAGSVFSVLLYLVLGIIIFTISMILLEKRRNEMTKISNAMEEVASGNLNYYVSVEDDDEISYIANNINKMQSHIRELIDKERKSEQTKNELITNVAHDLRTPLTSILGYLEILHSKLDTISKEQEKHYIDISYSKAKRLESLVEDLFGFTKIGKTSMKIEEIDIVKLLMQLLDEFEVNLRQNGLSSHLSSTDEKIIIEADLKSMLRLFENLINNAIKYGSEGKEILVKIFDKGDTCLIKIINFGEVIPNESLSRIFDKFYRVEQSRSTETGGTGLGLAIVKNIVEEHSGSISVTSNEEGTSFDVILNKKFVNKQ